MQKQKHVDEELFNMSKKQRNHRLSIQQASNPDTVRQLKHERNVLMHLVRSWSLQLAEEKLDQRAKEIEKLKDSAKMYKAAQLMRRRTATKPAVVDTLGRNITYDKGAAAEMCTHFSKQLQDQDCVALEAFDENPRQLEQPITAVEVASALGRLNKGRTAGDDTLQSELLKYCADEISPTISVLFNNIFERHEIVDVGHGLVIPIQKLGKPRGSQRACDRFFY